MVDGRLITKLKRALFFSGFLQTLKYKDVTATRNYKRA